MKLNNLKKIFINYFQIFCLAPPLKIKSLKLKIYYFCFIIINFLSWIYGNLYFIKKYRYQKYEIQVIINLILLNISYVTGLLIIIIYNLINKNDFIKIVNKIFKILNNLNDKNNYNKLLLQIIILLFLILFGSIFPIICGFYNKDEEKILFYSLPNFINFNVIFQYSVIIKLLLLILKNENNKIKKINIFKFCNNHLILRDIFNKSTKFYNLPIFLSICTAFILFTSTCFFIAFILIIENLIELRDINFWNFYWCFYVTPFVITILTLCRNVSKITNEVK